jgi:hypothetical protein
LQITVLSLKLFAQNTFHDDKHCQASPSLYTKERVRSTHMVFCGAHMGAMEVGSNRAGWRGACANEGCGDVLGAAEWDGEK